MEVQFHQKPYFQRISQKHDQKCLFKNISLPTYNGEKTVKIKGLLYVNQWYDDTKIVYETVVGGNLNQTNIILQSLNQSHNSCACLN